MFPEQGEYLDMFHDTLLVLLDMVGIWILELRNRYLHPCIPPYLSRNLKDQDRVFFYMFYFD
tara:strand:- start:99 stop:284 length:186 start_codon:yes stop_codon:yes gene_type:complete